MTLTSSQHTTLQQTTNRIPPHRKRILLYTTTTALAAATALATALWLGGDLTQTNVLGLEIGGTGSFTSWGLPTSTLLMELASAGTIGMLLTRLLLPEPDHTPTPTARRCLRTATHLALAWALSNAAMLLFNWSDVTDQPITALPITKLFTDTANTFPDVQDYISTTAVALMITLGLTVIETRWGALLLLPLALYNLIPMVLQGHASHGTILKYSLIIHVIAITPWVGGLAALLLHVRNQPELLAIAVPRFSTIALACYLAIATSGILASWQLLVSPIPLLWQSRYGILIILKAAALITLGIFGWWHRKHTVHKIQTATNDNRARNAFIQLSAAEILIMAIAIAIAVALSRTASPDTILLHNY